MSKKIFVSSTCFDLIDIRAELKQFLFDLGFVPVLSDHLDSGFETGINESSIETCLTNLRASDIVIIILSQRYGSTLEKFGYGKISATHLEYNTAIEEQKKIFFFVRDMLVSEAILFEKNGKVAGHWIKEKDSSLFSFYEEHKKLAEKNKNNWISIFSNSLDIKKKLNIELKTEISTIRFKRLSESNQMPFIAIKVVTTSSGQMGNRIQMTLKNETNISGQNYKLIIYKYNGEWRDEKWNLAEPGLATCEYTNGFSFIDSPKPTIDISIKGKETNYRLFIEIAYSIPSGDRVMDIYKVAVDINGGVIEYIGKALLPDPGFNKFLLDDSGNYKQI